MKHHLDVEAFALGWRVVTLGIEQSEDHGDVSPPVEGSARVLLSLAREHLGRIRLDRTPQHPDRLVRIRLVAPHAWAGQLHRAVTEAADGQLAADRQRACRLYWTIENGRDGTSTSASATPPMTDANGPASSTVQTRRSVE